jgi:hypothetical protein
MAPDIPWAAALADNATAQSAATSHALPAASIGRAIRRNGGSIIDAESLSLRETQVRESPSKSPSKSLSNRGARRVPTSYRASAAKSLAGLESG